MSGRQSRHKSSRRFKAPPARSRGRMAGALLLACAGLVAVAAVEVGGGRFSGRASAVPLIQDIAELLDARSPGARLGAALSSKARKLAEAVGLGEPPSPDTAPRSARRLLPRRTAASQPALAAVDELDVPALLAPLAGLAPQLATADPVTGSPGSGGAPGFVAPLLGGAGGGGGGGGGGSGTSPAEPTTPTDTPSPTASSTPTPSATATQPTLPELPGPSPVVDPSPGGNPAPVPVADPAPVFVPLPIVDPSPGAGPFPSAEPTPRSVPAVPEPASWLTMILGLGLIGARLRRSADKVRECTGAQA